MDEALMEQQRQAYAVKGVDEAEPTQANRKAKRKKDGAENGTNVCTIYLHSHPP